MTYYVSSGTLNPTHSVVLVAVLFVNSAKQFLFSLIFRWSDCRDDKSEDHLTCPALYCVLQLCTVVNMLI